MSPDICIYHGPGCMDGLVAAWAIWKRWPDVKFIPAQYRQGVPVGQCDGKHVLIVDFSYKKMELSLLGEYAKSVTVLDHHKTAQEDLAAFSVEALEPMDDRASDNRIQAIFDMEKSGARLAWEYALPDRPVSQLVRHVEDRDLWRFNLAGTREVHAFLTSLDDSFDRIEEVHQMMEHGFVTEVYTAGQGILRAHDKAVAAMLAATIHRMMIAGHDVPAANLPPVYASDAGNLMAPGEKFAATYYQTSSGEWSFSLRSAPDGMDVSVIASQFGGGGHKHAAGFKCDTLEPV